jgi:hypothetical protein
MANSRMKDFYDLWVIACQFSFDGAVLSRAIHNTFSRRRTLLPEHTPAGLSPTFHDDAQKNKQWNAFHRTGKFGITPPPLVDVCRLLETFLVPPTQALRQAKDFKARWEAGGPWR